MAYDKVGNLQLTRIMGGDMRIDPAGFDIGIRDSWKRAIDSVIEAGGKPYPIPAGASDHPLGGLGFANWAREVAQQEAQHGVFFDHVIVCTVTGSTHAGMIAGFALEARQRPPGDRHRRVQDLRATLDQVTRIASDTADRIGVGRALGDDEITLVSGYEGPAYGMPDAADHGGDPPRGPHGGHADRPGVRGQVDGRPDRDDPFRRDRAGFDGAVRPSRRPAGTVGVRRRLRTRLIRRSAFDVGPHAPCRCALSQPCLPA